jgi:hypothetical protein
LGRGIIRYGRLQDLGIRFADERVVLHLEPQVQKGRLKANTSHTMLVLDHDPLPWSRWGEEFATSKGQPAADTTRVYAPRVCQARHGLSGDVG